MNHSMYRKTGRKYEVKKYKCCDYDWFDKSKCNY